MTIDKGSISKIEKWLKKGTVPNNENKMYVISASDHCRAIENLKKLGMTPQDLFQCCDNICNGVLSIDLRKKELIDALYDREFFENHVSKNQNGLSIASFVSFYYQEYFPEERDLFIEDIDF